MTARASTTPLAGGGPATTGRVGMERGAARAGPRRRPGRRGSCSCWGNSPGAAVGATHRGEDRASRTRCIPGAAIEDEAPRRSRPRRSAGLVDGAACWSVSRVTCGNSATVNKARDLRQRENREEDDQGCARVSTRGQAIDGYGLAAQETDIRRRAKRDGHRIVGWESDEGLSGTLTEDERPGLFAALKMIRDGQADGLIVGEIGRLAASCTSRRRCSPRCGTWAAPCSARTPAR